MTSATDAIRKSTVLHAPISRVWAAISDASQFGRWFGVRFDGPFVEGQLLAGRITPTTVDEEVARLQEPHAGTPFVIRVERVEPMQLFAFRWHPGTLPPEEFDGEPTTLVEFRLATVADGTELTVVESGFDGIPLARRAQVFAGNSEGWTHQLRLVGLYVA